MKKQEYVSPEMEIVEIKAQYSILAGSGPGAGNGDVDAGGDGGDEVPPGWG